VIVLFVSSCPIIGNKGKHKSKYQIIEGLKDSKDSKQGKPIQRPKEKRTTDQRPKDTAKHQRQARGDKGGQQASKQEQTKTFKKNDFNWS
jgi:hypothetical protein